jgi:hypothetical protein
MQALEINKRQLTAASFACASIIYHLFETACYPHKGHPAFPYSSTIFNPFLFSNDAYSQDKRFLTCEVEYLGYQTYLEQDCVWIKQAA